MECIKTFSFFCNNAMSIEKNAVFHREYFIEGYKTNVLLNYRLPEKIFLKELNV